MEWRGRPRNADRTAATFETWLGERVTQVAVAWILATVFVRFCEDNGLIEYPFIAGPGERADQARELQDEYLPEAPGADRPRLDHCGLRRHVGVPGRQGPLRPAPQPDVDDPAVPRRGQGTSWRSGGKRVADGQIVHDFDGPGVEHPLPRRPLPGPVRDTARKTYALLQTPEFVEEFILKYTLDPAIEEFGLTPDPPHGHARPAAPPPRHRPGLRQRPLPARRVPPPAGRPGKDRRPATDRWELIRDALSSVHGVDKNPFAVAIARFRLMLAAMRAGGE